MDSTPWIQSLNPDQTTGAYSRTTTKKAAAQPGRRRARSSTPTRTSRRRCRCRCSATCAEGSRPGWHAGRPASRSRWARRRRRFVWSAGVRAPGCGGRTVVVRPSRAASRSRRRTSSCSRRPTAPRRPTPISPEAQTIGSGTAWVFTQGRMIEGRWDRAEPAQPWQLTACRRHADPADPGRHLGRAALAGLGAAAARPGRGRSPARRLTPPRSASSSCTRGATSVP